MPEARAVTELERAILRTIAYADIFDYPLTPAEVQRYLIGLSAAPEDVEHALHNGNLNGGCLVYHDGFITLTGRETVIDMRRQQSAAARSLWPVARYYGQIIGRLPFVRMVAVTGSLAADNAQPSSDIDYLIVTKPGRLWICRLFVIGLVKWAERQGHTLCPNYFLSENALVIAERNLFVARELAQMVPVWGIQTYQRMRKLNRWTDEYLPNAADSPIREQPARPEAASLNKRLAELLFEASPGRWLETWEMNRKIRKLTREHDNISEADFSPDRCKGHFDGHMQHILDTYHQRLHALEETYNLKIGMINGKL
jgi:hypothetical protein